MSNICNTGPLIHLSQINLFFLLQYFYEELFTTPEVYQEVVIEGNRRAGEQEAREAVEAGWIKVFPVKNITLVQTLVAEESQMSYTDATVIALAQEMKARLILADERCLREAAQQRGFPVIGSVGIIVRAKLLGLIPNVKEVLDELIVQGFYLLPQGAVYRDALRKAGEI